MVTQPWLGLGIFFVIIRALRASDVGSKGRAMAQAVSRRLLTAEALILFQRYGICGGRSSFFSEHLGFPLSLSFHLCAIFFLSLVGWAVEPLESAVPH